MVCTFHDSTRGSETLTEKHGVGERPVLKRQQDKRLDTRGFLIIHEPFRKNFHDLLQ